MAPAAPSAQRRAAWCAGRTTRPGHRCVVDTRGRPTRCRQDHAGSDVDRRPNRTLDVGRPHARGCRSTWHRRPPRPGHPARPPRPSPRSVRLVGHGCGRPTLGARPTRRRTGRGRRRHADQPDRARRCPQPAARGLAAARLVPRQRALDGSPGRHQPQRPTAPPRPTSRAGTSDRGPPAGPRVRARRDTRAPRLRIGRCDPRPGSRAAGPHRGVGGRHPTGGGCHQRRSRSERVVGSLLGRDHLGRPVPARGGARSPERTTT